MKFTIIFLLLAVLHGICNLDAFCCQKPVTCTTVERCIAIPARGSIPAANIFVRQQYVNANAPVLFFVHATGWDADEWLCEQASFCPCFNTIAIDLRGHGRSTLTPALPAAGGINYTQTVFVDDINAVLSALGITSLIWVGNSIGGALGINYNANFPGVITKLVLSSTNPFIYNPDPACSMGTFPNCSVAPLPCYQFPGITFCLYEFLSTLVTEIPFPEFAAVLATQLFFTEPACTAQLQNAQNSYIAAQIEQGQAILFSIINNAFTDDQRALLPGITIPVLICQGTADMANPVGVGAFLQSQIPNSILALFENKCHFLVATAFSSFDSLVAKFINGCTLPSTITVPDTGCNICPLITPVPLATCTPT